MKFLWGSRGALAPAAERHSKFEQILTVMANKFNAEEDVGTPVQTFLIAEGTIEILNQYDKN